MWTREKVTWWIWTSSKIDHSAIHSIGWTELWSHRWNGKIVILQFVTESGSVLALSFGSGICRLLDYKTYTVWQSWCSSTAVPLRQCSSCIPDKDMDFSDRNVEFTFGHNFTSVRSIHFSLAPVTTHAWDPLPPPPTHTTLCPFSFFPSSLSVSSSLQSPEVHPYGQSSRRWRMAGWATSRRRASRGSNGALAASSPGWEAARYDWLPLEEIRAGRHRWRRRTTPSKLPGRGGKLGRGVCVFLIFSYFSALFSSKPFVFLFKDFLNFFLFQIFVIFSHKVLFL